MIGALDDGSGTRVFVYEDRAQQLASISINKVIPYTGKISAFELVFNGLRERLKSKLIHNALLFAVNHSYTQEGSREREWGGGGLRQEVAWIKRSSLSLGGCSLVNHAPLAPARIH